MSEELKYIVTSNAEVVSGCPPKLMYLGCQPVQVGKGDFYGGFSYELRDAILYPDHRSAQTERNRIQKMFSDFPISVKSRTVKEIFVERLS